MLTTVSDNTRIRTVSLQQRFKKSLTCAPATVGGQSMAGLHDEKHYTLPELAKKWHFSPEFIHDLFLKEDGVIKISRPQDVRTNKRAYVSLRIPESVAIRVHERLHGKIT